MQHAVLVDSHAKFEQFLRESGKASATVIAYSKDIEQLIEFVGEKGKTLVAEVTADDIDEFKNILKQRRYTSKSISRKINSIKAFFRYLIGEDVVESNPAESIAHPKIEQTPPRVLTRLEYRALRDACRGDERLFAIVELLLQTGMRISELASLQMDDVDLDRGIMVIQAQNSRDERKVPLNKAAKKSLMDYLKIRPRAREKTVFLTKTSRPFLVRNIRTAIDRYFRLAGIKDAKVNDLRHTFIVEQLKAGTPLVYVSQLVGHKRITTTEKYLNLIDAPDMNPNVQIEEL
ncbi:MAG: Tyrosine recombinase XerC [Candidatus Pacebacteria bacterium GW2011_GWA1_46_10]|nr:MAG: Tyrosine recombinase XerC [Candidatus Pacebacteria bacterium GW2011_GWA1_46_10]